MRTILVYLTIVSLLLCPYDCAVKSAAAQAIGSLDRSACCESCRARATAETPNPASERQPQEPTPAEDGRSCLCEGAVFDAAARSSADTSSQVSFWIGAVDSAVTLGLTTPPPSANRVDPLPPHDGGRLTRIAICSLLV
jgi:hypothetical protein